MEIEILVALQTMSCLTIQLRSKRFLGGAYTTRSIGRTTMCYLTKYFWEELTKQKKIVLVESALFI